MRPIDFLSRFPEMEETGDIEREFFLALDPPPLVTVSEWADTHRVMDSRSPVPGRWRTELTPYIREIMDRMSPLDPCQRVVFKKAAQTAGPLALDTVLPTMTGQTTMGEVRVGDRLLDERGQECRVTYVSEVFLGRQCFKVTFDDGQEVVCDDAHLWTVLDFTKTKKVEEKTLHLRDFRSTHIRSRGRKWYGVRVIPGAKFAHADLPVDPYVLGVWLGNGSAWMNHVTVHEDDGEEIAEYLRQGGVNAMFRLPEWRKGKGANIILDPTRKVEGGEGTRSAVFTALRGLGVVRNKHIPMAYLRASTEQRMALLQGLMDTDGTVDKKGRAAFCNASWALIEGVQDLLRGLGKKTTTAWEPGRVRTINEGKETLTKGTWTVEWTPYAEANPFRLRRKRERVEGQTKERLRSKTGVRRIVDVRPVPSVPVRCISVDSPSHLYLCAGFIPTHNTEAIHNAIGYGITYVPGPMLMVQSTVDLARDWSKDRFQGIVDTTPVLQKLLGEAEGQKEKDADNTLRYKRFPGGSLFVAGANAPAGLRSKPVRYLYLDEVDSYPKSAGKEGDPVNLAEKRTSNFASRKIFLVSTPTIKGESRISRAYDRSDQRRYYVPCPHCGHEQILRWEGVTWEEGKPQEAWYKCEKNGCVIEEMSKKAMLSQGKWVATNPGGGDGRTHGYHISTLYSPFKSWGQCALEFVEAKPPGQPANLEMLKTFVNTVLGEDWDDEGGREVHAHELMAKREKWWPGEHGIVIPRKCSLVTAGVDTQDDRIEGTVWAWAPGKQGWCIDRWVVLGDPRTQPSLWDDVATMLSKTYPHESGIHLPVTAACIDSGGHATDQVLDFAHRNASKRWWAIQGFKAAGKPIWTGQALRATKKNKRKACYPVGTHTAKSWIHACLVGEEARLHFPLADWCNSDFFSQLCAEKLKSKFIDGHRVSYWWKPDHARNEILDTTVYAVAAMEARLSMGQKLDKTPDGVKPPEAKSDKKKPAPAAPALAGVGSHYLPRLDNWLR